MIKTGKVSLVGNILCFVSEGKTYIIPYEQYNSSMLGKEFKAEVNSIRGTVEKFL